jgi:hypothetical protein
MPTSSPLLTPDARRDSNRLLDVLQRERTDDRPAAADPSVLGSCGIHAQSALIEQAKGALMLHFGIDSHQAFVLLIDWARTSRTPVATIAHALLRGICEGNPQTELRQRALLRWLEEQLADGDPGPARLRTAPTRCHPDHKTPPAR